MSKYSCEQCGKDFSQKSHYDSHKKRKNPCVNYANKMQDKIEDIINKKVEEKINDLNLKNLILENDELNNQKCINITTFKELYEFLQKYDENNIISWLEVQWKGKDKQESF